MTITQPSPEPDSEADWRRPVREPDHWCYACWYVHPAEYPADPFLDCGVMARPEVPRDAVNAAAMDAVRALGLPTMCENEGPWEPAHVETARALIANLQMRIDVAEWRLYHQ